MPQVAAVDDSGPCGQHRVLLASGHERDTARLAEGPGLVVPVGAIEEPFVRGFFTLPAIMPWPDLV